MISKNNSITRWIFTNFSVIFFNINIENRCVNKIKIFSVINYRYWHALFINAKYQIQRWRTITFAITALKTYRIVTNNMCTDYLSKRAFNLLYYQKTPQVSSISIFKLDIFNFAAFTITFNCYRSTICTYNNFHPFCFKYLFDFL